MRNTTTVRANFRHSTNTFICTYLPRSHLFHIHDTYILQETLLSIATDQLYLFLLFPDISLLLFTSSRGNDVKTEVGVGINFTSPGNVARVQCTLSSDSPREKQVTFRRNLHKRLSYNYWTGIICL